MTDRLRVSGLLSEKDVKRLTRLSRGGNVGPTALYYAGVTAPIISASVSAMVRSNLLQAGFAPYYQWFFSALIAAVAGIVWYLIFVRWSYRHSHGRGTELTEKTQIEADDAGLTVRRAGIATTIDWASVESCTINAKHAALRVRGADAIIIPDAWFGEDKTLRKAFHARLKEKAKH
jgi:hypothetical protein